VFYDPGVGTLERSDPWQKLKQALPNTSNQRRAKTVHAGRKCPHGSSSKFYRVRPVA